MTDITDEDRYLAREWATAIEDRLIGAPPIRAAARVILATVEAPARTIPEELQYRADLLDNGDPDGDTANVLRTLAIDAIQMEHDLADAHAEVGRLDAVAEDYGRRATAALTERDEARAEVERLTAERDGAREEIAWLRNGPGHTEVATDLPDPADVKPGEAWVADTKFYGRGIALRNPHPSPGDWLVEESPWVFCSTKQQGRFRDDGITLVSRLVPAPRVITDPDELDRLAECSVILSLSTKYALQRRDAGGEWYCMATRGKATSTDVLSCGPATVLWEPEA